MNRRRGLLILVGILVIVVVAITGNMFYTVPEGYAAAVYRFGKLDGVQTTTGLKWRLPFIQDVKLIDMREQSEAVTQNAYTKDTQTVENLVVKVNYRLKLENLEDVIRNIGADMVEEKIILPNVYALTRNTIGQYTADALIAHRAEVTQSIEQQLAIELEEKGIMLLAFTIQNIDFEDSFEAAVRRKVEAEQKALEAQNRTKEEEELGRQQVIRAQAEADAIRAKADAEAHAIEVINRQLSNSPHYIDYLKATRWDGKLPAVQGSASTIMDVSGLME